MIPEFRVWDDFRKFYLKDQCLSFRFGRGGTLRGIHSEFNEIEKFVCQLFTGLKDKNGQKIYEGDSIVNEYGLFIISFRNGTFLGNGRPLCNLFVINDKTQQIDEVEITGNIFENPELKI